MKNIVVAGCGVLGSQIAYQTAFKGFNVTAWLRSDASIERAKPKLENLKKTYLEILEGLKQYCGSGNAVYPQGMTDGLSALTPQDLDGLKEQAVRAYENIALTTDMAAAVKDADLVIESVAEDPEAKKDVYKKLAPLLPAKTIITTNSSTMLPSAFAEYTGRPEKYLALHFANKIWTNNTGEIMGHSGTSEQAYNAVVEFAAQIGMIPLCLKKEQPGYILNSLLIPFVSAGQALYANGIADPETIDLCWRKGTGNPAGPFQILDIVGLVTAYNIVIMNPDAADQSTTPGKIAANLKERIDAGKTGVAAGEGFYKYK